jgi:hypothetical protein
MAGYGGEAVPDTAVVEPAAEPPPRSKPCRCSRLLLVVATAVLLAGGAGARPAPRVKP